MSEQRNGLTFGLTMSLFFFHSQSIMMLLCCSFLCLRCCPFCVWHLEKCWTHSCPVSSVHKTTHALDLSSYSTHFPCLCSLSWAHTGSLALLEGSVCVKYHKHCHIFRGHSNTGTAKRCKVFFLTVNTAAVSSGDCWQNHFYKSFIDCNRPEQKEEKKVQIFSSLEFMFWLLCAANQRDWLQRACFYRYRATKRSSCCCPAYMSQSFMFSAPDENTQVFQAI